MDHHGKQVSFQARGCRENHLHQFPSTESERGLGSLDVMGGSLLFKFRKTGQGYKHFTDNKRLKKSISSQKKYMNFF